MKQFEEQFKDAFDGFEPEVDPSVWTNVSSTISSPAPIAGAASVSSAGGFSAVSGWFAAAIAILVGALIYHFASPASSNVSKDVQSSTTVNVPVMESNSIESAVTPNERLNSASEEKSVSHSTSESTGDLHREIVSSTSNESPKVVSSETNISAGVVSVEEKHVNPAQVINTEKSNNSTVNTVKNTENLVENEVNPILIASAHCGFAPLSITFMLNSNLKTDFNFGDGNQTFKTNSITHKYENSGHYTVNCEVNGKQLTTEIEVLGQLGTAFSPNGDGINDIFTFGGADVEKVEVRVYNRFGKTIFTGSGNNPGWDGNYSDGIKAESGTYFYDIFATSVGGTDFKQKGTINLFR